MPQTAIVIYKESDGKVPLIEWFDTIPNKAQDKCIAIIEILQEKGHELWLFELLMEHCRTSKAKLSFPRKRESRRFINVFWTPACAGVTRCLFHYLFKHQ